MGPRLSRMLLGLGIFYGIPAASEIGTSDVVPAATLLLPYFETQAAPSETSAIVSTAMAVRNAAPASIIAHVVLYTDYGVPTYAFDRYLTGYDVERFSLAAIFAENALNLAEDSVVEGTPVPGPTDEALFADGFESGDLTGWTTFASDMSIDTLRAYHTGRPSSREGLCAGSDYGDGLARGYVLVDAAQTESTALHDAPGYFAAGGAGIASNANVLTGDFEIRDDANNYSVGETLIHIEASASGETGQVGEYTFYSRYTGVTAADNREPLATQWAVRHVSSPGQATDLLYWRDVKIAQAPFPCSSPPVWAPLNVIELLAFDEEENAVDLSPNAGFPLACGRVRVGEGPLQTPFEFGWLKINFSAVGQGAFGQTNQAAVIAVQLVPGRFAIGNSALALDNALLYTP